MSSHNAQRQRGQSASKGRFMELKQSPQDEDYQNQPSTPLAPSRYGRSFSNPVAPQRRTHRSFFHVFTSWWLEILTCFIVLLVLMAFVITLWKQQHKPLQSYTLGITINTLTAIYTIILKTLCVFLITEGIGQLKWLWYRKPRSLSDFQDWDRASRGPWGAVVLLWSLKHRGPIGSFGALVVLATLVADPFAQQILTYEFCQVPDPRQNASVPRTNYYTDRDFDVGATAGNSIPIDLQQAIFAGLFSYENALTTTPDCYTGNCTFPDFWTVGYCGSCTDISDQIIYDNQSFPFASTSTSTVEATVTVSTEIMRSTVSLADSGSVSATPTDVTIPTSSSVKRQSDDVDDEVATVLAMNYSISTWGLHDGQPYPLQLIWNISQSTTDVDFVDNGPQAFMNLRADTFGDSFALITAFLNGKPFADKEFQKPPNNELSWTDPHLNCNDTSQAKQWPCQGQGAANCSITPCLTRIHTNVSNGNVVEEMLESVPISPDLQTIAAYTVVDTECASHQDPALDLKGGLPLPGKPAWLIFANNNALNNLTAFHTNNNLSVITNVTYGDNAPEWFIAPPNCTYSMYYEAANIINKYLSQLMNGNATQMDPSNPDGGSLGWDPRVANGGGPLINTLYRGGNLTFDSVNNTFANIGKGISRYIRTVAPMAPEMAEPALGIVSMPETCIVVRWNWIAYPAILVVLVLIFTLVVIIETGWVDDDHHDWKTSALPVLFNGLEHKPKDGDNEAVTTGAMKRIAKPMNVQLDRTEKGWRLRNVHRTDTDAS